ncbi:MAG: hypothetical protein J6Y85_04525 [Alphaproteobacteria bacterium]|nr:hypothetical protein [Alphaproteobacteria bacterium]
MKKLFLLSFLLCGCHSLVIPDSFQYQKIQTDYYKLASWQKITDTRSPIRIYLEGDGYAFNYAGQPTNNPTPRGTFLRKIAFNDPNSNVVYLARPCQYITDSLCTQKDWTTGRFSEHIIDSILQAIQIISKKQPVILIGYSGGALLSGLVINKNSTIPIQKWITLAGVLNHTKWTQNLHLPPLTDSADLNKLPSVPQLHLIGDKDQVVPYPLTKTLVDEKNLIIIPNATHDTGYENYLPQVYGK